MDALTVLLALTAAGALIALVIVGARHARLRGQVQAVLHRRGSQPAPGSPSRGLYRTVLELERAADGAQREASLLRLAVDHTEIGIVIADRDREIVFTNPAAEGVMKGRLGEAVARTRVLQLIERVTFSGIGETLELDLYTPSRRILNLSAVPLPGVQDPYHGAVVYIIDFTDRYRVEAMRRDFVANASHELKTPLGAMSILAETLIEAKDESMRLRLAERLRSEATRMARVIDDVLVLAETESFGSDHVPIPVSDVLEEAVASVRAIADENGIEMTRGIIDDAVIAGDHQQLVSAFQNLLNNAITYTAVKGEGGSVRYRCIRDEGGISVQIEDSGVGIPERYTNRVFERFFRVDRARSRESGGTGLGLSIVRNVAIAHGGRVEVRSEVGVGSTFMMWLPVTAEESE